MGQTKKTGKDAPRLRRDRDNIRQLLVESAIIEFGARGFDGASTRSIAERIDAHQPQINYHFSSKDELWRATVDALFAEVDASLDAIDRSLSDAERFCQIVRIQCEFAARRPQLNQIMIQETASPGDRLTWITETHIAERVGRMRGTWSRLREQGLAAPIDDDHIYYVLVGATCLPYVNASSARLILDEDPCSPERVEQHIASLTATFLPGLPTDRSSAS